MLGEVVAVVGAQYGSEAKGAVVNALAPRFTVHVRTGAPNAGHTIYHQGKKWVMRSVPCGWVNPDVMLVIGAGALIDVGLLNDEVEALDAAGFNVSQRLFVDLKAGIIDPVRHHEFEGGVGGYAHAKIGSTGEGVGPARMARIARGTWPSDVPWAKIDLVANSSWDVSGNLCDTVRLVNDQIDQGSPVLLEGTQGSGLSLIHGPWPTVTSSDANAGQLATDAGISPSLVSRTILVARTFPIRVAGRSGPLYEETTWEELGVEEERTTVTKKVRRVAPMWPNIDVVKRAVTLNRPAEIALTFANYVDPLAYGVTRWKELPQKVLSFIHRLEEEVGAPVTLVGTDPVTVVER